MLPEVYTMKPWARISPTNTAISAVSWTRSSVMPTLRSRTFRIKSKACYLSLSSSPPFQLTFAEFPSSLFSRAGSQNEQKALQQKNLELIEMYREKSKKQAQTQHLYDTLKKRVMTSQVQTAASDSVAQAVNSISALPRPQMSDDPTILQGPQATDASIRTGNGHIAANHFGPSPGQSTRTALGEARIHPNMPPPAGPMDEQHTRKCFKCMK